MSVAKRRGPPRLATSILVAWLPAELRDDVLGDLHEGFQRRQIEGGDPRRWYWHQALQSLRYARSRHAPPPKHGTRRARLREALMEFLRYDVSYALRQLRANPGFTTVAVLSLALGIGVNATIFSLINGFFFKPLPVTDIDEVVEVYGAVGDARFEVSSYPDYVDLRDGTDAFAGLAASMTMIFNWNRETHSEMLFGEMVSGNYFDVLGVEAAYGRMFLPEEDGAPAANPVVVLGHGFWQRNFGGDPAAIGRTIKLNGMPFTIVGVAPARFTGTMPVVSLDLWAPLANEPILNFFDPGNSLLERRGSHSLRLYGRLATGATIDLARAQLATVAARLARAYPATNGDRSTNVKSFAEVRFHPVIDAAITPVAGLLMALVGLVLLVACANVANMLLARASARSREIGVRLAMGASRWRLIRQLLTEAVVLSMIGAGVALLVTVWLARALVEVRPPIPIVLGLDVSPDARVLGFTIGIALLTGLIFGLAPALRSSKPDLIATLKYDAGGRATGRGVSLRSALILAQVSISTVLLVGAALFARSLGNAHAIELGFDEENLAFVTTTLNAAGYDDEAGLRLLDELVERLDAMPDVVSVAYAARLPMNLTNARQDFFIEGHQPAGDERSVAVEYNEVGPGYFETLRIPLVAGRDIAMTDTAGAPPVAIINETFANEFWPGQNPLGKRIKLDAEIEPWIEVVGVCADYKMRTVGEPPQPIVHLAMAQQGAPFQTLLARTNGDPAAMVAHIRRELQARDPNISFFDARTMRENLATVLYPMRMATALLATFGLLALSLAAVGVYGVIAYSVAQRTHEIGVRMALGARPVDVLRSIVGGGMKTVVAGIGLGLLGALALARVVGSMLYDVSALDPVAFAGTVAVLVGVALLANYIPARRGARVDPMVALRRE